MMVTQIETLDSPLKIDADLFIFDVLPLKL
jgi:hypothetical protein